VDDSDAAHDFNSYWFDDESAVTLGRIAAQRNVTPDRARRIVRRGKALLAR